MIKVFIIKPQTRIGRYESGKTNRAGRIGKYESGRTNREGRNGKDESGRDESAYNRKNHPDTLSNMSDLADTYHKQERYDE